MRLFVMMTLVFSTFLLAEENKFPLCVYMANYTSPDNLAEAARQGFNIVRPATEPYSSFPNDPEYIRRFLDKAHRCNLKVIFPFDFKDKKGKWKELRNKPEKMLAALWKEPEFQKEYCKELRETILRFKDHPAVYAWDLQDELNSFIAPGEAAPFLAAISEADGSHPVILSLYLYQKGFKTEPGMNNHIASVKEWAPLVDILSYDSYPHANAGCSLDHVNLTTRTVANTVLPGCCGHAIKAFAGAMDIRAPDSHDVRYMCYASIVNGVRILFFFHFQPSLEAMRVYETVIREINELSPFLVNGKTISSQSRGAVSVLHKTYGGKQYFFTVNNTADKQQFELDAEVRELSVLFEGRKLMTENGKINDTIEPYGVHVYAGRVATGVNE